MLKNIISNRILFIAVLLISFFRMNLEEGNSACPTGFTPANVTVMVNGCQVNVDLCVKCAPHALVAAEIRLVSWVKLDTNCNYSPSLTTAQEMIAVKNAIIQQRLLNLCSISPCCPKEPQDPPCYNMKIEFYLPLCIQKTWDNGRIIRHTCITKDGHCISTRYVCVDTNGQLVSGADTYTVVGNYNCEENSEPADPTKGDPVTACFKIETPCGTP